MIRQVKKSIDTGELQLEFWDKVTHFEIVLWLIFTSLLKPFYLLLDFLYDGKIDLPTSIPEAFFLLTVLPFLLTVVFFFIQKHRLRLTAIDTPLTREQLTDLILQIAQNN